MRLNSETSTAPTRFSLALVRSLGTLHSKGRADAVLGSRCAPGVLLWARGSAQHPRDRLAWPELGGPVRHVRPQVLDQDGRHDRQADGLSLFEPDTREAVLTSILADLTSADDPREEPDLPRHQARQLPDRPSGHEERQPGLCRRLWHGQAVPGPQDEAAHPVPRAKELERHGALHEHQHASRPRAVAQRRPRGARPRLHVLPERRPALARPQGGDQQAKVREDWRKEAEHADQGAR